MLLRWNMRSRFSGMSVNWRKLRRHCSAAALLLQSTTTERPMRTEAAMPTSVLPAPQGRTIMPDRARFRDPNMPKRAFSW